MTRTKPEPHDAAAAATVTNGIATEDDVHKMRQRLAKRIVKAVVADTRPQTVGTNRQAESAAPR